MLYQTLRRLNSKFWAISDATWWWMLLSIVNFSLRDHNIIIRVKNAILKLISVISIGNIKY